MAQESLQAAHIAIGVLTGAAAALLGLMFWNSASMNSSPFTKMFLRLLSVMTVSKVLEIGAAMYRASQIEADAVPVKAAIAGLSGRSVELVFYFIMVWFLLRPETKRALNGRKSPLTPTTPEE